MDDLEPHVVRQGEYLSKLAEQLGFDAEEAWNHPRNQELRELRGDPHVLLPGDILWYAARPRGSGQLAAGSENGYVAEVPRVELRVRICDHLGEPLKGEAYEADDDVGVEPAKGNLDGDGVLTVTVPILLSSFSVAIPSKEVNLRLLVGHVDPHTETSGAAQRLKQLGYYRGSLPVNEEHPGYTRSMRAFQEDEGLPITGQLDPETAARLNQRFGR